MIKVLSKIKTYTEHAISPNEEDLLVTESSDSNRIILDFNGNKISVYTNDLIAAIKNAANVNRY